MQTFSLKSMLHRVHQLPPTESPRLTLNHPMRLPIRLGRRQLQLKRRHRLHPIRLASKCAILASKVVSQQQKNGDHKSDDITAMTGHKTLDLVPIENLPKALTIADFSPAPMHGSTLRVAYQGVPGAVQRSGGWKGLSQLRGHSM